MSPRHMSWQGVTLLHDMAQSGDIAKARWPDGSLRVAVEDWLGAGAILRGLPGIKSAEAVAAIRVFESSQHATAAVLAASGSGRELILRGFESDVDLAAQLDVSDHVPLLENGAFVAQRMSVSKTALQPPAAGVIMSRRG